MMSEQGSEAWLNERSGCATASAFIDIIAVSKSNGRPLKARDDYLWKLATERLYGTPTEAFTAKSTDWGKELEPFAIQAYEVQTGNIIVPSGFVLHPTIKYCGASPDGLIANDGGIEIKCPKDRRVHIQTWRSGMPVDHLPQVQGNIWINGREWFDFISYDPRSPEEFRIYVERIYRDDKYILALQSHIVDFLAEVETLLGEIHARKSRILRGQNTPVSPTDNRHLQ
jgi:hypothetical protein